MTSRPVSQHDAPVVVFDGAESSEGRALFVVSALASCTSWLSRVNVRFSDVENENVVTALDAFSYQYGIAVDIRHTADRSSPLCGANVYAAVAFRSLTHLRLSEARAAGIPTMLAVQFPQPEWISPAILLRQPAAFDPARFAADLGAIIKPWLS